MWSVGRWIMGFDILPYQVALGFSLGYFEGFRFRFYFGPFKLWGGTFFSQRQDDVIPAATKGL